MPGSSSAVTVSSPRFDRPPPPIVLAAGVLTAILPVAVVLIVANLPLFLTLKSCTIHVTKLRNILAVS